MLQVYSEQVVDAISNLLAYIHGVSEFENILGNKVIDKLNQVSDDLVWIIHEFE